MLMRFDPFRELDRLNQAPWGGSRPVMPMDAYRRNGDFVVHFDLPGIDPGTIELTVEKNVLTVTAERRFPKRRSAATVSTFFSTVRSIVPGSMPGRSKCTTKSPLRR